MDLRIPSLILILMILTSPMITLSYSSGSYEVKLGEDEGFKKFIDRSNRPYDVEFVNTRFIVFSSKSHVDVRSLVESLGGRVVRELKLTGGLIVEGAPGLPEVLRRVGLNVYVDRIVYLMEPLILPVDKVKVMLLNETPSIGAPKLVEMGFNGSGVRVAVVDTGVENLHPWLIRGGGSVVGWEVDATGTGVIDYCGKRIGDYWGGVHGTHIAGIIASQNPREPGVAPGVDLYDIIVFPEMIDGLYLGCYSTLASYVIAGIELALLGPDGEPGTGDEADVISLSLGYIAPPELQYSIKMGFVKDPLIDVLEEAVRRGKVVVVAAGNAYGLNMINALCLADGVICVGASSHMGTLDTNDDMLAWFSSKGPGPLGTLLPHVVAPGVYVYSSIPTDLAKLLYLGEPADYLSGTSMSTPFISGSAALLISYFKAQGMEWSPKRILQRLVQTGSDVRPQSVEAFWLLPDWYKELLRPYIPVPPINTPVDQGGGLVNVYQAALAEIELSINGEPLGYIVLSGGRAEFNVTIRNTSNSTLSLAVARTLIKLWDIYTFRDVSGNVIMEDTLLRLTPGSSVNVKLTVSNLKPGFYAGYIGFRVVESGLLYRIPIAIIVPLQVDMDKLRFFEQLTLSTGTRDIWDVVTLYLHVTTPLLEPLAITTLMNPGAPGMISVTLTTPSGKFTSFTNTIGYALLEPGYYTISSWILFAFEWPIYVNFTLAIGAPVLTQTLERTLRELTILTSRITLIESTLNTTIKSIELLRSQLSIERARIDTLNKTLATLDKALSELGVQISEARRDLERLATTLSTMNTTLSERILLESRRLDTVSSRLDQARSDLEQLRLELNTKSEELGGRITAIEGAHSTTRLISIIASLAGILALAIGAYLMFRRR